MDEYLGKLDEAGMCLMVYEGDSAISQNMNLTPTLLPPRTWSCPWRHLVH
jgi:hypothetical protein